MLLKARAENGSAPKNGVEPPPNSLRGALFHLLEEVQELNLNLAALGFAPNLSIELRDLSIICLRTEIL